MVKLSATLSLVDGFSNKLNAVNNSLQRTSSSMDKFKNNVSKPISNSLFNSLNGGIRGSSSEMSSFSASAAAKIGAISGVVQSLTTTGINVLSNGIREMVGELSSASATWQTFEGNMAIMGKGASEIKAVKAELQDFATKTIYSASDMSSTYSQLAAVGTKNTTQLVEGFGGLAAAAEDPAQAMKTLSQQATQMAALPKVQWMDFKLMLQQTPAGMAAVAKQMGKSTEQLVKDIQGGKVATQDFFDAISKVGGDTNGDFYKMATKFKTIGQAMDGLKEGLTNKLQPAFDKASKFGIRMVTNLGGKLENMIDPAKLSAMIDKFGPAIEKGATQALDNVVKSAKWLGEQIDWTKQRVQEFWNGFKDSGAVSQVQTMFDNIGLAFKKVKATLSGGLFTDIGKGAGGIFKEIATVIGDFANSISKLSPGQMKEITSSIGSLVGAFMIMKNGKALALATGISLLAKAVSKMSPEQLTTAAKALAVLGAVIMGIKLGNQLSNLADGLGSIFGKNSSLSKGGGNPAKPINELKAGLGSLAKSAGIALVIGSLAGLALALKPLASLGTTAIAPLVAFGATVGALGAVFSKFGSGLQKNVAGIAIFAASLSVMALAMTPLASLGTKAIAPLITFGAVVAGLSVVFSSFSSGLTTGILGIGVFAAAISVMALTMSGIANAGAGAVANMITFGVVIGGLAVVFALLGPLLTAGSVGILAFGAAVLMAGIGLGAAAPFMQALPPIIMAVAMAFSMAAMSISMAISQIIGAVSGLVAQIGASISQVATTIGTQIQGIITQITGFVGQVGDSISQVVSSISNGFSTIISTIGQNVQGIIDSISGGLTNVLNGISGVIDSIGNSARNAGEGFKMVAEGISQIASLSIWDIGKSLGAVATGIGQISSHAGGLSQAGSGMQQLANGVTMAASGTQMFVSNLERINGAATQAIASASQLQSAFSNITITPPNTAPITAAFTQVVAAARTTVAPVAALGTQAGQGYVNGFRGSIGQAVGVAQSMGSQITGALSGVAGQMYGIGLNIGQGLANGMNASLGAVAAAASALAAQADKAARAKAEVHSPSRVFMATGQFFGQGLAIGMQKQYDNVANAGAGLFDSAYLGNNEVPSQNTEVIKSSSPTQNANSEVHYTVECGAIVVQGTGNAEYDGELITEALEKHLMSKYSASLLN